MMSSATSSSPSGSARGVPTADSARRKAIALAVAAAVGGFLFGFDSSVINGAVDAIEDEFNLGETVLGLAVAIALLGCAVGAWAGGRLADHWGRTRVMLLGAVLFFVSSIGSGLAFSVIDLMIWRVVGGLGIGIASVIAPAYIAEIAPSRLRGRLASLQQLAITIGIFAALLSDALWATSAGSASNDSLLGLEAWRWMFLIAVVPATVYGILALRIPESPRYLVAAGERREAKAVLQSVLGPTENAEERITQIEQTIESDREAAARTTLRGPAFGLLPIVWIGIGLSVFQQFVGINVIFYYSVTLWQAVGFNESDSFLVTVITSVTNILVTLIAIALVDKLGRRPLLLIGSAGMTVTLGLMALAFTFATGPADDVTLAAPWSTVALVSANLFVVFFGATWGPVVWVLLGEIFPNRIRAAALGVAAAAQWIANFAITISFPSMLAAWGATGPYLMYAIFAALSFIFVFTRIPETKGVELEDMGDVRMAKRGSKAKPVPRRPSAEPPPA